MARLLTLKDPQSPKSWTFDPFKRIKSVHADVYARWVINCIVPLKIINTLLTTTPFLKPQLINGQAVLSLCAIFMRNAAPSWMPLHLGPGSQNCALRIACIDTRDKSSAVWVGERHTNSFLAPALEFLGFPPVANDLCVTEAEEMIDFQTADNSLICNLHEGKTETSVALFKEDKDFETYFCAGISSYSTHNQRTEIIDLHKLKDNRFENKNMQGRLKTSLGEWPVESAYLTKNGLYQWEHVGRL